MLNFILGDSRFFWSENIKYLSHLPYSWDSSINSGIGLNDVNTLWITSYLNLTASFYYLGLSWGMINMLFWIVPILVISFVSSFFLAKKVLGTSLIISAISGIIFTSNTYFLSIFLGGQFGVSFAYAFSPLVLLVFINLLDQSRLRNSLIASLALGIQVLFDPRIALLTCIGVVIYYFFNFNKVVNNIVLTVIVPPFIVLGMHLFWILPLIFYPQSLLPVGYDSALGAKFFSFANLENSISLLHPNWPENIFGKTYFMRPEFLLLPLLAFSGLLFIKNNKSMKQYSNTIIFFALLAILGAFLSKGANDPFGSIFLWLFEYMPGGSLFRDPTKFYIYVALSFSILIPFTISSIVKKVKNKKISIILPYLFIVFWLFTLRLFVSSEAKHLGINHVPNEYVELKDFIVAEGKYFRTLWIPAWQRYGYFTDENPSIGRGEIFKEASLSGILADLKKEDFEGVLQDLAIKYVIVPYDSEGEIFIEDRKYSEKKYISTVAEINKIRYLKERKSMGKIRIFEVSNPKDHFWSPSTSLRINYKFINPTKYKVNIENAQEEDKLIFSESFDKDWVARNSNFKAVSSDYNNLNSFTLPKSGNYTITVEYEPQRLVYLGIIMSSLIFWATLLYVLFEKRFNRRA